MLMDLPWDELVQMHWLVAVLFAVYGAFTVSYLVSLIVEGIFLSRLRKRYCETWEELGRPTSVRYYPDTAARTFLRFLWRRQYHSLSDEQSIRLGKFVRAAWVATVVLFVLSAGVFVAGALALWGYLRTV